MRNYTVETYIEWGHWSFPLSIEIWGSSLGYKAWTQDFTIKILCFCIDFIYYKDE